MPAMHTCQSLALQQAPPKYDNAVVLPRSCSLGFMGAIGPHSPPLGMAYDPIMCDMLKQSHDLNFDARRTIYDDCMQRQETAPSSSDKTSR